MHEWHDCIKGWSMEKVKYCIDYCKLDSNYHPSFSEFHRAGELYNVERKQEYQKTPERKLLNNPSDKAQAKKELDRIKRMEVLPSMSEEDRQYHFNIIGRPYKSLKTYPSSKIQTAIRNGR